jgi:hypothetical protein
MKYRLYDIGENKHPDFDPVYYNTYKQAKKAKESNERYDNCIIYVEEDRIAEIVLDVHEIYRHHDW